ncbi:class I SAM-dependent methyltransferase [Lysobacter sp. 5GHs7-4]|uniref:class I SAM-dependent methyltransferase n=1 Tax=Lysobacter sp. 5GHs7-4 TaxID=2904253 RepID=UPI001E304484|nr:class I SAM-dependent methyltransferase [Lysobacter sp. 5GHs7-4]UHQ24090.1 class I SAM-dependent methyltransferase [Lysobacter sp. 5GHs7-4]
MPSRKTSNARTVAGYENCALAYAAEVPPPTGWAAESLQCLVDKLPAGARVLEIGSGPGWDADFLEERGLSVHRTDVTAAFVDFQIQRGKAAQLLDALTDEIAGRYDGIAMLCVLQHFERADLDAVLRKFAAALNDDGLLLASYPLGEDEYWQKTDSGDYRVVRWSSGAMDDRLRAAGFAVEWDLEQEFDSGPWRAVLARRRA